MESPHQSVGKGRLCAADAPVIAGNSSPGRNAVPNKSLKKYSKTTGDSLRTISRRIIGTDDRVPSVKVFPHNVICRLLITNENRTYFGTGFFIYPRCVITAGHCVYDKDTHTWAGSIEVIPGADGANEPYGRERSDTFRTVAGWLRGLEKYDYGAVILNDNTLFDKTSSYLGYKPLSQETQIEISGYSQSNPDKQMKSTGMIMKSADSLLYYELDTEEGTSGSPVFIREGDNILVIGIHVSSGENLNHAVQVSQEMMENFAQWSAL